MKESISNEKQLLEGLAKGYESAFTSLYFRYGPSIHAHVLRMTRSEEIAEELLQDVFVKIWENRRSIDPEKSFRSYLYRIAENKVYDFFRRVVRERRFMEHAILSTSQVDTTTEERIIYDECLTIVRQGIEHLSPVRKEVFRLCKLEGKSYDEIAEQLGISPATVNDHMVKANRFIKSYLTKHTDIVILLAIMLGN